MKDINHLEIFVWSVFFSFHFQKLLGAVKMHECLIYVRMDKGKNYLVKKFETQLLVNQKLL